MDPFSQILSLLKPQAVFWTVIEAHNDWTIRFNPSQIVVFGQLIEGRCRIDRDDGRGFDTDTGDVMLMPLPPPWTMSGGAGGPPVDFKAVIDAPAVLHAAGQPRTVTRLMAGNFEFDAANADLVAKLMAPIVHVRASEVSAGRLGSLLRLLGDEATAARPGRSLILGRLLEALLVEALRSDAGALADNGRGLMAGLADARLGRALAAMHADASKPWTVAALAREAGMSRSAFAAAFAQTLGLPPMDYLANWRMTLAREALLGGKRSMADIAELAGYQSVSAFSTAFRRVHGCSPTGYVERQT